MTSNAYEIMERNHRTSEENVFDQMSRLGNLVFSTIGLDMPHRGEDQEEGGVEGTVRCRTM